MNTYEFIPVERCNMCGERDATVLGKRLSDSQGLRPNRRLGITTTVVRCPRCGLIYSNPLPVRASIDQHYNVAPEHYWGKGHRATRETVDSDFAERIAATFSRLTGRSKVPVLDIGAGTGQTIAALRRAGFDTWGIEPSESFYQVALSRPEITEDRLTQTSIEAAEFEPNAFAFINFGAVLEHLYDPSSALLRALGWLQPDGVIHIQVPSAEWLTSRLANWAYRLQGLDYVGNLSPMHSPYHLYEFTLSSFAEHARSYGHQVAYHRRMVAMPYLPLPRLTNRLAHALMDRTGTGMQLEVWLRKTTMAKPERKG